MNKYVIVTPARDEAAHIQHTIDALSAQTVRPAQWIIVDDGSRDGTGEIVDRAASLHDWITVVHRANRGYRKAGGGVIEAFNAGYQLVREHDWQFLVKLDADLSFEPEYFEKCFAEFGRDRRLGIGGGGIYHKSSDGTLQLEPAPSFHVRGATKIYKRECWDGLGGLVVAPGWDTIDELKANMLGWNTRSFPSLRLLHYRPTGAFDGVWRDSVKNGLANYVAGYHPIFMAVKCAKRLLSAPYLKGALGLAVGFCKGYLRRVPQVADPELIAYTRSQQIRRLLCLESIWR